MNDGPVYRPLGEHVGILETRFVRTFRDGRFLARPARLLVIDPSRATAEDWLTWQSMGEMRTKTELLR